MHRTGPRAVGIQFLAWVLWPRVTVKAEGMSGAWWAAVVGKQLTHSSVLCDPAFQTPRVPRARCVGSHITFTHFPRPMGGLRFTLPVLGLSLLFSCPPKATDSGVLAGCSHL